jgi:8-oxo-dGTP pyrophosphatase MutT (NUDIX family)
LITETKSSYAEPEWGFPKGRRMKGESDVECAIREFYEETNIPSESYTVLENVSFTEVFKGTNDVSYKHVYFVALMKDSKIMNLKQKFTQHQRREISNIGWKTLKECKQITRPHYSERKKMITELERMVSLPSK